MGQPVIDLDDLDGCDALPDGSGSSSPPEPPLWTAPRRRAAIAVAVVLTVGVLAADTARGTLPAAYLVSQPVTVAVPGTPIAAIGDSLYATADRGSRLTAYSLETGRRRWSVDIPKSAGSDQRVGPTVLDAGPRLLLVTGQRGETLAIDAGTGIVEWRRPGTPFWLASDRSRVALATSPPSPDPADPGTLAVVTMATGANAAVFTPYPGTASPVFSADSTSQQITAAFARQDAGGGTLFDFDSGRTRRLDLPLPSRPPDAVDAGNTPEYESLLRAGDLIVDTARWGGHSLLTGYAGDPPRPRWSTPDLDFGWGWWCGALLCGPSGPGTAALDPATGEVRWTYDSRGPVWRASGRRLYASTSVNTDATGIAVLDETTGQSLLRQALWRPVAPIEGARIPIIAFSRTGETLAILDARRLTTYRIAALPPGDTACWASQTHVACRTKVNIFRVWRYSS
jgi:outer membrane protein assembly factor BamB